MGSEVCMLSKILKFFLDENGATAIEYGLICALVVAVVAALFPLVGGTLGEVFQHISSAFAG